MENNTNTGDLNTGDLNTGDLNTGDLNTNTPSVRLFNKDSGLTFGGEIHSKLWKMIYKYSSPLCEWISEINMSDEEKEKYQTYKTTGGYLKVNKTKINSSISDEDRKFFENLPNFDAEILKVCTGIDLLNPKVKIVIDGKETWISKESAEELKKAFCEDGKDG